MGECLYARDRDRPAREGKGGKAGPVRADPGGERLGRRDMPHARADAPIGRIFRVPCPAFPPDDGDSA